MTIAATSNSLDSLLLLIEYMKDAKKRAKELAEMRDERDQLTRARETLENAAGGKTKLLEADRTLALAQEKASNVLAESAAKAKVLVEDANTKAGDVVTERANINRDVKELHGRTIAHEKTVQEITAGLMKREERVTKRENDIARMRDDVAQDKATLRKKADDVASAMKG